MNQNIDMKTYGLSQRFVTLAGTYEPGLTPARVISQEKGICRLMSSEGEKLGEVSGRFRYLAQTASDYPAVGDFVMADWNPDGGHAVIHHVLPRKSCLLRRAAGDLLQEQVVAANLDTVFLCMALNGDFNLRRLERYLSMAWDSGAVPVIVLTKADLCQELDRRLLEVSNAAIGADILVTTAMEEGGYTQILPYPREGQTVAFIGSSGVGKSTLINRLLGEDRLDTNGLRRDDRGRHTTTRRELFLLPDGGMVIDTPGMRELGMWDSEAGIDRTFGEIEELARSCRFHDCTHSGEPGCAVRKALEEGTLSQDRWQSYQKLKAENAYQESRESYLAEKGKKFKEIAKYNKTNRKR